MNYKLVSTRDYIGKVLIEMQKKHKNLVVIDSDLASSVKSNEFAEVYPNNFFEMGIAEQSSMSSVCGFAMEGFIPIYVNFSIFVTGTVWTQLRQACYSNFNFKIIGSHPGMDNGPDGATHHALEDIALSRVIPNITVFTPSDMNELKACVEEALKINGPVYIRTPRDTVPVLHDENCSFQTGKAEILEDDGNDIAIIFEGSSSKEAYEGFLSLKKLGYKNKLINIRSIKPIDSELINKLSSKVKGTVTVENHNVSGGLNGAISEEIVKSKNNIIVKCVGVNNTFTESGKTSDVKKKYGLSSEKVVEKALEIIKGL